MLGSIDKLNTGKAGLNLYEFVCCGRRVLMDGALGTELERRSVDVSGKAWSAMAVENEADVIVDIHHDYIKAGAKLHIANSFSLGRHVLETVGQESHFESLNRASVKLVNQAIEKAGLKRSDFWVAGSVSTFFTDSDRSLLPDGKTMFRNAVDQLEILVDEGIDVVALEMLADYRITKSLLRAAEQFDLPIIVGLTCEWSSDGDLVETQARSMGLDPVMLEDLLPQVVDSVKSPQIIFSIMHTEPDVTDAALQVLRRHWPGPVAVYPNSGTFSKDQGIALNFDSVQPVDQFRAAAENWIAAGVGIVGGCCGIGPDHIASVGKTLSSSSS